MEAILGGIPGQISKTRPGIIRRIPGGFPGKCLRGILGGVLVEIPEIRGKSQEESWEKFLEVFGQKSLIKFE